MFNNIIINKKVLIISSWAPPKIGGAPQCFYNLFSLINCKDFCILTSQQNFIKKNIQYGRKLNCDYYFYNKKKLLLVIEI